MPLVYFLRNWYSPREAMAEETLNDSEAMRRLAGIELGDDGVLDESTIVNFRHLLEWYGLSLAFFADVNAHLADKGLILRSGTMLDVTIIDAPSSAKNKDVARDPGLSSTNKSNSRYFGMKAEIGMGVDSGLTQSLDTTTARFHDSQVRGALSRDEESSLWADKGYVSTERETDFNCLCRIWGVISKAPKGGSLHPLDERNNRLIAIIWAWDEHPFRVIKRQFGHLKARYRSLAKNRAEIFTFFARANLLLAQRRLTAWDCFCSETAEPPLWRY